VEATRYKEDAADIQKSRWIMKNGIFWLRKGLCEFRQEEERRQNRNMHIAIRFNQRNILR
jgi:hypothetical protein